MLASPAVWRPPHPRIGGKRRDRKMAQAVWNQIQPTAVGVTHFGFFGEGQGLTRCAEAFFGADPDPGIASIWNAAKRSSDGLLIAGQKAREILRSIEAASSRESRIDMWRGVRELEHTMIAANAEHAHVSLALGAGSVSGGSRRNRIGMWTQPVLPFGKPVMQRLIADEVLDTSGRWVYAQQPVVYSDWRQVLEAMRVYIDRNRLYYVDPPYGSSPEDHYGKMWNGSEFATFRNDLCADLARRHKRSVRVGAVIWCGAREWLLWSNDLTRYKIAFESEFIAAKSTMKAAKKDADGRVVRPARKSEGGHVFRVGDAILGK